MNENNILYIYEFIKNIKTKFNNEVKLDSGIFISIRDNNELKIDFCAKNKSKNYSVTFGFHELELRKINEEFNNEKLNIIIKSASREIIKKIKENE